MPGFADSPVLVPAPELALVSPPLPAGEQLLEANLYAVCELIAGRAARASSARQYRSIYTRFGDALRAELGRPPVVGDVTGDAIAAYSRQLELVERLSCPPRRGPARKQSRDVVPVAGEAMPLEEGDARFTDFELPAFPLVRDRHEEHASEVAKPAYRERQDHAASLRQPLRPLQ